MTDITDISVPTINLAKLACFIHALGISPDQFQLMMSTFSLEQCRELGECMNVFEDLDFGIVDEPGEADDGQLYVSYSTKEEFLEEKYMNKLVRYPEEDKNRQWVSEPQWVGVSEIVVPDEHSKEQLLLAFEYIHDLRSIDTDIIAVNTVAHLYQCPDRITVKSVS